MYALFTNVRSLLNIVVLDMANCSRAYKISFEDSTHRLPQNIWSFAIIFVSLSLYVRRVADGAQLTKRLRRYYVRVECECFRWFRARDFELAVRNHIIRVGFFGSTEKNPTEPEIENVLRLFIEQLFTTPCNVVLNANISNTLTHSSSIQLSRSKLK